MAPRVLVSLLLGLALVACDGGDSSDAGPETDAGSRRDAGASDAGASDAGQGDAGRSDAGPSDGGSLPPPGPRYVGRHDATDPSAVRMSWSGSGLVLRFRGTGARVSMDGVGTFFSVVVDGADQHCDFSAATENHFLTWGAIAARALGAELSAVAWSGKGVVHNYGDDRTEPMPTLYDRVIATEPGSTGVIREAHAVIINLGTNDYSTGGDPTDGEIVPAYVGLLEDVRAAHPDALIACTVGPPLPTDDMTRARSAIESAIATRRAAGDERVTWVDLDGFADWGCDWHPGDETQALLAEDLVAFLRTELGW